MGEEMNFGSNLWIMNAKTGEKFEYNGLKEVVITDDSSYSPEIGSFLGGYEEGCWITNFSIACRSRFLKQLIKSQETLRKKYRRWLRTQKRYKEKMRRARLKGKYPSMKCSI